MQKEKVAKKNCNFISMLFYRMLAWKLSKNTLRISNFLSVYLEGCRNEYRSKRLGRIYEDHEYLGFEN